MVFNLNVINFHLKWASLVTSSYCAIFKVTGHFDKIKLFESNLTYPEIYPWNFDASRTRFTTIDDSYYEKFKLIMVIPIKTSHINYS